MLLAQKEQLRQATTTSEELPNVGSFGKVVNSIQGLQQRLEHFTADDVGIAHDRTQILLARLADLQRKLNEFTVIKESMAAVHVVSEQMLADCVNPLTLTTAEQPLSIESLVQARKLIQFPRLNNFVADPLDLPNADVNPSAVGSKADDNWSPGVETDPDINGPHGELPQETAGPLADVQPAPSNEASSAAPSEGDRDTDAPSIDAVPDPSSATTVAAQNTACPTESRDTHAYDSPAATGSESDEPDIAVPQDEPTETAQEKARTEFDQRLLDDLIKNYGEFATALSSTRTTTSDDVVTTTSGDVVTTTSGDVVTPEAAATETDDAIKSHEVVPERDNLPSIKKEGDIDRQLKKIIKDYGEYDLYSRQGPVNLKTGVIAAFLLLGIILSGFYYFAPASSQNSPPAPAASVHSSATEQPQQGQNVARQVDMPNGDTSAVRGTDTNSRHKNRK